MISLSLSTIQTKLAYLQRGWRTPDPAKSKSITASEDDDEWGGGRGGIFQRMGLSKMHSMDWRHYRPGGPASAVMLTEKQKRSMEEISRAHKERIKYETIMNNLEQDGNADTEETDEKNITKSDLQDNSSKTSFFGCVCNVANTLLVSSNLIHFMSWFGLSHLRAQI